MTRTRGRRNDDETMLYTETFKARMVRRMLGPKAVSANALSEEIGIAQPTLSRWLRETATFRTMKEKDKPDAPPPPPPEVGKRAQDWTPKEKLGAVAETASLEGRARDSDAAQRSRVPAGGRRDVSRRCAVRDAPSP